MILARTLRRTFVLRGPLPDDCVAFLQADPKLPAPSERTDVIDIVPRGDGLLSMSCSWGRHVTGSARALARALDETIYRLAASDEGTTPSLNASVVRLDGIRILLVAEPDADLCDLVVALILLGAAFEGISRVFLRASGVVAHPVKPRLRSFRLASAGLALSHSELPTLLLYPDIAFCAIDPRLAGVEWSVMEGPVSIVLFVERNDGGRSAIMRLRRETAFARLLRNTRFSQRPDARTFIGLRAMIEDAGAFRMSMGDPAAAAALIVAQMPQMRVDERSRLGQVHHP